MSRLRSLFVCPCWRCRQARRNERDAMTAEEAIALMRTMVESDRVQVETYGSGAAKWREAIRRHVGSD